jgi:AcrR family transcriptional regulator
MTRNQKKAETRAAILAAAIAAFTEGSAVTTPVEAVARAAGVSKATLFFHFGSRLELLEAVAEEIYRFGVDTIWRPPGPGLAPFLRDYLGAQRTPTTRLLWEIGDVLAMNQRPGPDVAYGDLIDEIAGRLDEEGIDVAMRPALAQVVASATLFVARRMVFNQADDDEIQRFQATVESIIAPWRTRSS